MVDMRLAASNGDGSSGLQLAAILHSTNGQRCTHTHGRGAWMRAQKKNRREAGFEEWRARPGDMPEGRIDGPTDAKARLEEMAL